MHPVCSGLLPSAFPFYQRGQDLLRSVPTGQLASGCREGVRVMLWEEHGLWDQTEAFQILAQIHCFPVTLGDLFGPLCACFLICQMGMLIPQLLGLNGIIYPESLGHIEDNECWCPKTYLKPQNGKILSRLWNDQGPAVDSDNVPRYPLLGLRGFFPLICLAYPYLDPPQVPSAFCSAHRGGC